MCGRLLPRCMEPTPSSRTPYPLTRRLCSWLGYCRHLAVCMGQHGRLGARSWLRCVDNAVLYMILEKTVSIPRTADSMLWVLLTDAAGRS